MSDSSDIDASLGCATTSRRRRRGRPQRVATRTAEDPSCCVLCTSAEGALTCDYKGFALHPCCWNAVRCHRRLQNGSKESLNRIAKLFETDKPAWRSEVRPLIKDGKVPRSARARGQVKRVLSAVVEKVKENSTIADRMLLSKRRFISFHKFWDEMSSSEASQKFDEELGLAESDNCNSDGEPQVTVKDHVRLRSLKGQRLVDKQEDIEDVEGGRAGKRKREEKRHRSATGGRAGKRRREETRKRSPSLDDEADADDGHTDRSSRSPPPSVRTRSSVGKRSSHSSGRTAKLTAEALAKHAENFSATGDKGRKSSGAGEPKMTAVQFLKVKSDLKDMLEKAIKARSGPKSVVAKLETFLAYRVDTSKEKEKAALKSDMQTSSGTIRDALRKVKALQEQTAEINRHSLASHQTDVDTSVKALADADDAGRELVEAFEFLTSQDKMELRRVGAASRYKQGRTASLLLTGGFQKGHAKFLSTCIFERLNAQDVNAGTSAFQMESKAPRMMLNPEEPDFQNVCVWNGGKSKVEQEVEQLQNNSSEAVQAKVDSLTKSMKANEKWFGAMTKVAGAPETRFAGIVNEKLEYAQRLGTVPRVAALRKHSFRFGAAGAPLPGVGCFLQALSDLWLQVYKIEDLAQQGIHLKDVMAFLETSTGQTYLKDSAVTIFAPSQTIVHIPWGSCYMPLYAPDSEDAQDTGFLWSMPVFATALAKKISSETFACINTINDEYHNTKNGSTLWTPRKEVWRDFYQLVKEAT